MKNRINSKVGIVGLIAVVLTAGVVVPLVAQPDFPVSPTPGKKEKGGDLLVPPGIYSAFVFAYDSRSDSGGVRVTLKTVSGNMTIIIPASDTVVIPMPANFALGQQGTIVIHSNSDKVSVAGMTPSGPVTFEPAKK